jgi:hypothetical protein
MACYQQPRRLIVAKEHSLQFFFAGSGCFAGTMVCCVCHKPIDAATQDWRLGTKIMPDFDWEYRCRHRSCVQDQSGWGKLTAKAKARSDSVSHITDTFRKLLNTHGEDNFRDALNNVGIETC